MTLKRLHHHRISTQSLPRALTPKNPIQTLNPPSTADWKAAIFNHYATAPRYVHNNYRSVCVASVRSPLRYNFFLGNVIITVEANRTDSPLDRRLFVVGSARRFPPDGACVLLGLAAEWTIHRRGIPASSSALVSILAKRILDSHAPVGIVLASVVVGLFCLADWTCDPFFRWSMLLFIIFFNWCTCAFGVHNLREIYVSHWAS